MYTEADLRLLCSIMAAPPTTQTHTHTSHTLTLLETSVSSNNKGGMPTGTDFTLFLRMPMEGEEILDL